MYLLVRKLDWEKLKKLLERKECKEKLEEALKNPDLLIGRLVLTKKGDIMVVTNVDKEKGVVEGYKIMPIEVGG